jgi:hypothetical protein
LAGAISIHSQKEKKITIQKQIVFKSISLALEVDLNFPILHINFSVRKTEAKNSQESYSDLENSQ